MFFSCVDNGGEVDVHIAAAVEVSPENLPVVGVVTAGEVLLSAVVDDRDADGR